MAEEEKKVHPADDPNWGYGYKQDDPHTLLRDATVVSKTNHN